MASADITFPLHGHDAEVPVVLVGVDVPLLVDGTKKTVQLEVTNPKESSAKFLIDVSVTGLPGDPLSGYSIRRPNASNMTYPQTGLTFSAGHTEPLTIELDFVDALVEGQEAGLRIQVTEA
jgi:hypothetical protein